MSTTEIEVGKTYTVHTGDRRLKHGKTAQATVTAVIKQGLGYSVAYNIGRQSHKTSLGKFRKFLD